MIIEKDAKIHIARLKNAGWFISTDLSIGSFYLHEDLTWNDVMKSKDGTWQYTETKKQSEERLNKWRNS